MKKTFLPGRLRKRILQMSVLIKLVIFDIVIEIFCIDKILYVQVVSSSSLVK